MIIIFISIIPIFLFTIYILVPWLFKIIIRNNFLKKIRLSNTICLTFDDGPDPEATPEILRLLREAAIKATFFITGENVEKYPEIVTLIAEEGHEIGEHSYKHLHPWKSMPIKYMQNLFKMDKVLKKYKFDTRSRISFRPPYGKLNIITLFYIWLKKRQVIFWNIDPKDYQSDNGENIAKNIINNLISTGSVILLHDGRAGNKGDVHITIEALNLLVKIIGDTKKFSTISDVVIENVN